MQEKWFDGKLFDGNLFDWGKFAKFPPILCDLKLKAES
jgi:hypothetical protein